MIISNITTRKVTTKFGEKDVFDVESGGEVYSYGFKKPPFKVGDDVAFAFSEDKYGKKVDVASVRVLTTGSGGGTGSVISAAVAPSKPSYGPPTKPFPIPPLHGDRAIVRQNALTNARELWVGRIGQLAKDAGWSPESEAAEIITLARIFESYSTGDSDLAEAMKGTKE